jgi:hypothetical protein
MLVQGNLIFLPKTNALLAATTRPNPASVGKFVDNFGLGFEPLPGSGIA